MDIQEVKAAADIVEVVGRYVALKKKGKEWVGLCPFHDDKKPSMGVVPDKDLFKCLACGEGGDVVDFVTKIERCEVPRALEIISNTTAAPIEQPADKPKPWIWVEHCESVPPMPDSHYQLGQPSEVHKYTPTYYVVRFNTDKGKEMRPLIYAERDGKRSWRWQRPAGKLPLYNTSSLVDTSLPVVVVEGEKTCNWLQGKIKSLAVIAWHGGVNAVDKHDWSPLQGRKVLYWPDNDAVGYCAMVIARELCGGTGDFITSPLTAPQGWDVADSGWTAAVTLGWLQANRVEPQGWGLPPDWSDEVEGVTYTMHGVTACALRTGDRYSVRIEPKQPEAVESPAAPQPPATTDRYFRCLGYFKSDSGGVEFAFYVYASRMVHYMTSGKMTKKELYTMAPPDYWEALYPARGSFDADTAASDLMQSCYRKGIFNMDNIRGRGAWRDGGRYVIHAGDSLYVDGKQCNTYEIDSKYIYEVGNTMDLHNHNPINKEQGRKFIELLSHISWERRVNAQLLAGWCVIAPICGALMWRPHVWITGGAGTGKTYIMREIVMKIMGPAAAPVEGSTTESGIRQYLGHDALPVIFDEAEAEDKNAMNRIEEILNLMRISSAESASKMLKGTAGHAAKSFSIRSSFLFASIIYQARKHADRTRVSVLGLSKYLGDRDAHFEELKRKYIAVMSDDFVSGFHARTITMLPTLMANIEVFTKVASEYLGSSRLADQIAPLCAGAWLLASDKVVTEELARRWMEQQDWEEERSLEGDRDELQLLSYLLECVVKVEQGEYGSTVERTIGELIDGCLSGGNNYTHVEQMKDRLLRVGIKIDAGRFIVSNTAKGVRDLLRGTQWEKNHGKVLQRIDGAECTGTIYFMSGHSSRGVAIAWKSITTG